MPEPRNSAVGGPMRRTNPRSGADRCAERTQDPESRPNLETRADRAADRTQDPAPTEPKTRRRPNPRPGLRMARGPQILALEACRFRSPGQLVAQVTCGAGPRAAGRVERTRPRRANPGRPERTRSAERTQSRRANPRRANQARRANPGAERTRARRANPAPEREQPGCRANRAERTRRPGPPSGPDGCRGVGPCGKEAPDPGPDAGPRTDSYHRLVKEHPSSS